MKKILKQTLITLIILCLVLGQAVYAAPPKSLSDIKGNWAEADIQALFKKGIITGNDKGKYEPNKSITRAEFTALLVRAMGLPLVKEGNSFYDVDYAKFWGKPYIETAVAKGIIIPSEIGTEFFGNVPLKRIDMAVMMARALGVQPSESQASPYVDIETPNGYVTKLYEEYLMRGYTENGKLIFKQNNQTNKAEAATVVSRLLQYKVDPRAYVEKVGREDRLKEWTPTEEDFESKLAEELKKQEASKTYIMEPIIRLQYEEPPYYGAYFNIVLLNLEDYAKDCYIKVECLTIPELNVFEQPTPSGSFSKFSYNVYRPIELTGWYIYTLRSVYYTTRANINKIKITPGMELDFKISIKRGTQTRELIKRVKVPTFTQ